MTPSLIVVTDWGMGREPLLQQVQRLTTLGPEVAIQHRHPEAATRQFLDEARALDELCRPAGVSLFVNGRLDVALLLGAHLHLPGTGPLARDVRPLLPPGTLISVAVHDAVEAKAVVGADIALVSPVFGAGSKPGDTRTPLGPEGFAEIAAALTCPAYALGGITPESVGRLPAPSTRGIAAITGVLHAPDPVEAARTLLDGLRV